MRNKLKRHDTDLADMASEWKTWTPTISWGTATPDGVTTIAMYKKIGKTVFFNINITGTDGNGASTPTTITAPITPRANNATPTFTFMMTVSSTNYVRYGYIRDNGVNNDLYLFLQSAADGSSFAIRISGQYEID